DVHTIHYNLALTLEEYYKDYEAARKHYEKAISINADYALAHNNLGVLIVKHFQDFDNARKHFEEAIRNKPTFGQAYRNLSMLLLDKFNEYENANELYSKAVQLDGENLDDAIVWYEQSIKNHPEFVGAYTNLGIALMRKNGDVEGAKTNFEKALTIDPDNVFTNYNYATLLINYLDDTEKGCKHYKNAIEKDPNQKNEEFDELCGISGQF